MRYLFVLLLFPTFAIAADAPDFARDVLPIFTAHCAGCHNADEANSGYRVDAFEHVVKPITSDDALQQGAAITPGMSDTSRVYRLMAGLDEPRMPPVDDGDPVPAAQLAVVKAWIDSGAPAPTGASMKPTLVVPTVRPASSPSAVTAVQYRNGQLYTGEFGTVRRSDGNKTVWALDSLPGKVTDLAISPNGKTLYAATGLTGLVGNVVAIDTETGKKTAELSGHRDAIFTIAVSPDGQTLATGSYDRDVILWDLSSGQPSRTLTGHNGAIFDVAFDPKGQLVATASGDETVKVWSVETGERLDTMPQPEGEVYAVTFTPNGRHVFAASADNRIRKWLVRSRGKKAINALQIARFAHEDAVTSLQITADGKRVVSASADRVVRVWSAGNLTQLATLGPADDVVAAIETDKTPGELSVWLMNGSSQSFAMPTSSKSATRMAEAVAPVFPNPSREEAMFDEAEPNDAPAEALLLTLPAQAKGVIASDGDTDLFAFDAKKGEQWVVEVAAARGSVKKEDRSQLDSTIEVLDAEGRRIERVLLQAVRDSYFTFRGKNSSQANDFRVFNWEEMELGDLFYSAGEVTELYRYPQGPDSGFWVFPGGGTRHLRFDTTGVSHALGDPAYIVKPYPPGSAIAANGLPVFPVYYENDDDSMRAHGTDSVLSFTAPADGRFLIRVADARGFGSDKHSYTLKVRARKPDFTPRIAKKLDKIRPASRTETGVRINRLDGFEGRVDVAVNNLPEGFSIPAGLFIEPKQSEVLFPITVAEKATTPTAEQLKEIQIVASAKTEDGREVTHTVGGAFGKLMIEEKPAQFGIEVVAPLVDGVPTIDLHPGETVELLVKAARNDFKGRITFGKETAGRNLPFGVYVDNIGLNGLMIPAGKSEQDFFITAAPVAQPQERTWHIRASEGGGVPSNVLRVRVLPAEQKLADR